MIQGSRDPGNSLISLKNAAPGGLSPAFRRRSLRRPAPFPFFDEADNRVSAGRRKRRRDVSLRIVLDFIVPPMRGGDRLSGRFR